MDTETTAEKNILNMVEIWDLEFNKSDENLILDFKLANGKSEGDAAEGYIHIIAMDANKECPQTWNNTRDRLTECTPVNYRLGQQFLIQRFRAYNKTFNPDSESELPSFIKILAYDRSGHILIEKEFPVINVSTAENM